MKRLVYIGCAARRRRWRLVRPGSLYILPGLNMTEQLQGRFECKPRNRTTNQGAAWPHLDHITTRHPQAKLGMSHYLRVTVGSARLPLAGRTLRNDLGKSQAEAKRL
jgi:hypothetical protein